MQTLRPVSTLERMTKPLGRDGSPVWRGARYLAYLACTLSACSNAELDQVTNSVLSAAVMPSSVAILNRLYPSKLTMESGQVSAQPLTALAAQDQSGTADSWNSYLEFSPGEGLQATFTFTLPATVPPAQINNLTLLSNYRGQLHATQVWSFLLFDVVQSRWVPVGDNQVAKDWVWSPLAFLTTGSASHFVSATKEIRLRFTTLKALDTCDLDFLALSFTTDGTAATPTPPPVPVPAPPPLPTSPAWTPKPGTSWQIQFSGTLDTSPTVNAFDLDLFGTAKATIDKLHVQGTKAICYFSGGTSESYRPDFTSFPSKLLGSTLGAYPAERWLDVRQLAILGPIMTARMDLAVQKGCDALDVDNMDGYTNSPGFSISYAQQLAYNTMIATEAHKRGLSIGLKNDLLQISDLADLYDFAINESCLAYSECYYMQPFINRNKAVFAISYSGSQSKVCAQANSLNFDMLLKDQSLDANRRPCR